MNTRPLGHTGLEVSEIGLGAWEIGGPLRAHFESLGWISHGWGKVDDTTSIRMIHQCGDMGINFIDTAAGYGAGHSEYIVGKAVHGSRDQWIVETKGGEGFHDNGENYKDFSKSHLLWQIDRSLGRLRMDYVDIYLLHGPSSEDIERGECLEALEAVKASGKARFVGVSLGPPDMGLDLIKKGGMDVFQIPLSFLDVRFADEVIPAAAKAGIGLVARGAFGAGFLTAAVDEETAFDSDDRRSWQSVDGKAGRADVARRLQFLRTPDRTMAQSCLKFPLSFDGVSCVIAGSKNPEHMAENAAASDAPDLTRDELANIADALGRKA